MRWRLLTVTAVRRALMAVLALTPFIFAALPALAAGGETEIVSDGPLTRIIITGDLNCQVAHRDDSSFEFYGGEIGACGTFLATGLTLYGPAFVPAASLGAMIPWTPVSQSEVTGSGTNSDPFQVVTTVDAGDSALRIEQTDSYVIGEETYRTDIRVINSGEERTIVVYRAGDCYLQDSDTGFGRVDRGSPACITDRSLGNRIEQWEPITSGSSFAVGSFGDVWAEVATREPFNNLCQCDVAVDNGAGISWEAQISAGAELTFSHRTHLSPEGRAAGITFASSVPGPPEFNLSPAVIVTSLVLAAGIVLLVPFPSALFNSTLEENYEEITGNLRKFKDSVRSRLRGLFAGKGEGVEGVSTPRAESDKPQFWKTRLGFVAFVALSALIYSLLDPSFGFHADALTTFSGLFLGLILTLVAFLVPVWWLARSSGTKMTVLVIPGSILVAIACVVISRLADFQPGYLYGLIIGFGFTRELSRIDEGRIEGIAVASGLGASIVSWLVLPLVRGVEGGLPIVETALVTVVVAGLEVALFGMLPLRFLPGERVRAWNKKFWMIVLGLAAFAFIHILLNSASGYVAGAGSSTTTVIILLVVFGALSAFFWAFFRFRPENMQDQAPE